MYADFPCIYARGCLLTSNKILTKEGVLHNELISDFLCETYYYTACPGKFNPRDLAVEGDGMEMDCRRQPGWTLNKRKEKIKTKKFRAMLQQLLLNA
jgi:hypothetical protein